MFVDAEWMDIRRTFPLDGPSICLLSLNPQPRIFPGFSLPFQTSNFLNFPNQYLLILPFMEQRQEQVLQNPFRFLDAAAREVTTALARSHIRHGFIGGYATSLIGGVRMTSVRLFSTLSLSQTNLI